MTIPFVIFALPRSRTFWVSRYLTYGGWTCGHDQARYARTPEDVRSWLSLEQTGTVETAAAPFWRMVPEKRPDARLVVIRRPVSEVADSLTRTGVVFDPDKLMARLRYLNRKLDQIERHGALVVSFDDLDIPAIRARLFEHCLGLPFDPAWDRQLAGVNLQINFPAMLRYERANAAQLRRAEALCARDIRMDLRGERPRLGQPREDGVTIQDEMAATVYRDGRDLFAEHCRAVDEPDDEWTRKNIPMLFQLERMGLLHFVTARRNGRMLAYLQTILSPSLESTTRMAGTQTLFFASEDARGLGLGMALQRASITTLRRRGVAEIVMRAGVRGSGPKLGILYRRLGAEPFGQVYRLELKKAA